MTQPSIERKRYDEVLSSPEFLEWQQAILKRIYEPLLVEANEEFKRCGLPLDVKMTSLVFPDSYEKEYPAVTLSFRAPAKYPFPSVCSKPLLGISTDISVAGDQGIMALFPEETAKYYEIMGSSIHYPKRLGYMLDEICFSGDEPRIMSYCGDYEHNLLTSHILDYELYCVYGKGIFPTDKIDLLPVDDILAEMPMRKYVHNRCGNIANIFLSGRGRVSLLGVQMLVCIRNNKGSYDALRIRRAANLAAASGFFQFVPSGGFEAADNRTDIKAQYECSSPMNAIFRELLEECLGEDDEENTYYKRTEAESVVKAPQIRKILDMLEAEPAKARMELLGTAIGLGGLRQELSFLLVIEDADYARYIKGNNESVSGIQKIDIRDIVNNGFRIDGRNNDLDMLNPTSAALLELVMRNKLFC